MSHRPRSLMPADLSQLQDYIDRATARPMDHSDRVFGPLFAGFEKCLLDHERKWFKKEITYNDDHVGNNLFGQYDCRRFTRDRLKLHMFACRSSVSRIKVLLDDLAARGRDKDVRSLLSLLTDYIANAVTMLEAGTYLFEGFVPDFGFNKRNIAFSIEIIDAAQTFFCGTTYEGRLSEFVVQPTAIFLIRQAIEIRIKNGLGIRRIKYNGKETLKVPYDVLLNLLKKKPLIRFPVPGSLIRKIYGWANEYIHTGEMPQPWMIEWALHLLKPLFASSTTSGRWSSYGAVEIDRNYYQGTLKIDIILAVAEKYPYKYAPYINLERLPSPEAILI